jgi:hypothetical protein
MNVTVIESVFIKASPGAVFDYTQDWSHRTDWDPGILAAEVLQEDDPRSVKLRMKGGVTGLLKYKQFDRPHRTSVVITDLNSRLMRASGGAWEYLAKEDGTLFTQTNTIKLANRFVHFMLGAIVRWQLRKLTLTAMEKAKAVLEAR